MKANLSDVKDSPNLEHVPFERVEAAHHSLSEQIFKHERDVASRLTAIEELLQIKVDRLTEIFEKRYDFF